MGSKRTLICLFGNDSSSVTISKLLSEHKLIKNLSIKVPNFKILIKTHFINNAEHLLRVDNENINLKLINKYKILIIKKFKKGNLHNFIKSS